ncbi:protein RRP5 homolog [Babylonia areolata]|uniref:protein RRP5 homolog n=1 Tax=Babylonia areolata TaxID=304850 RepID=UPI003FD53F1C
MNLNMSKQENFPRGGKRPAKEDKTEESAPKKRKVKLSDRKVKAKGKHIVKHVSKTQNTEVDRLTFQTLKEGLLVLGRVKEVADYKVMVALPHGLLGTLPITEVSQVFSQHLQSVADNDEIEDVPTLKNLFRVGDAVQCRVTSAKMTGQSNKRLVELSTCPDVINKSFPLSALKTGCLLYGAIQSVEEHGCTMDVGIPGIKAFLSSSQSSEEGPKRSEGECVWCTLSPQSALEVMSGETRVIKVTDDNVLESEVTAHMVTSVDCLRPGMKVKVTVQKVLKDGLYVRCIKYKGCIYKTHVPQGLNQYTPGQEVEGRILFTHPVTKVISLSLLPGILDCLQSKEELFGGLSVGDFVEEAEVMFIDKTSAVFFRLENCTAMAPIQHLSDEKIKDVNKAFPRGSKRRCRVIAFQPADDVVLVTLKESIMKQKILSIRDLQPGQIVECTVEAIHESGVIVLLSKGLTGLIPKMHVADVPLKNFSKKFSKGDKLKCRVLKVDVAAKKVFLTKKKSLVNTTKDVPVSYDGLTSGTQLEGYVIAVKNQGVAIGFCNGVKGWAPRQELSSVEIAHPESAFYQGQVVRCRVLSCHPDSQKLRLSLIISGKAAIASKSEKMGDFEVGKVMSATVKRKLGHNVELQLQPSGDKALLPREHLSDSTENQTLLWQVLEEGDSLDAIMLLKQTNVPVVTLKESFLSAAREGLIPHTIHDLEPGQLVPAVIRNHQSYGIFVELPGGLGGLAPRKLTMDKPISDLSRVFACGQSVVVKVIEVNEDKGRFLCSLRLCDCYHDDPKVSIEMLETYLNERDSYLDGVLNQKGEGLAMGCLVKVTVKAQTDDGYICDTPYGMPAIITRRHSGEADLPVGGEVEGVVLHVAIDQSNCCLEVSADRTLVRTVSRRKEKTTMDRARQGQTIKGEVVMMKEDFVVVLLKQHAVGTLALMPRRQHLNDVLALSTVNLAIGEEVKVTIQKCEGDRVLVVLASLVKEEQAYPRHELRLGQTVSARVHSILPGQMNIKIGNVSGRVHVTEVVDEVENGIFPFSKYAKGQEVKVKIIGFRHNKSFKYLPISHPRIYKALPECTLKPSKLKAEDCPREHQASFNQEYKAGDKVPIFPIKFENGKLWVNVSPVQRGVLSVFDLSKDLGLLKHAEKRFSAGHGYQATVLGVEEEGGLIHLSLTGRREEVKKNQVVTGKVTSASDKGLALRLPGDFRGMVPADSKGADAWKHLSAGTFIRCLVLCCKEKENCVLSLKLTHRSEEELKTIQKLQKKERKRQHSESKDGGNKEDGRITEGEPSPKKRRKSSENEGSPSKHLKSESDFETTVPAPILSDSERGGSAEEAATDRCLSVSSGFLWDQAADTPVGTQSDSDEEDDDDEEEEEGGDKKVIKHGKLKTSEGAKTASGVKGLTKDYPRLVASSPNDSRLWIEYMVEQLGRGKVDVARSLANQALQTIAIEEQQEKLNVWLALLNLENLYGTQEDVAKTLTRALEVSDPLKLYRRVAAMYSASGSLEEAEHIHKTMLRRFKQDRHVWIDYGLFLYKNGRYDAARKLLQRALLSIDRKDHVTTITQFASLECKHGESERGFTMFDKVLAEYPKRFDVMTVYTDMVILTGDLDKARELFERSWTLKPSMRLFKKYLQFEEKHGTEETLARLQSRIENEAL